MRLPILKTNEDLVNKIEKAIEKEGIVLIPSDIEVPEEIKEKYEVIKDNIIYGNRGSETTDIEYNIIYDENEWVYYKPPRLSSHAGGVEFFGRTVTIYLGHLIYEIFFRNKIVVLLKNDFLLRKDEYQRITRRESIVKYIPDVYYNFNNYSCFENDYRRTVDLKLRVPPGTLILDGEGYIRLKYPSYHGYFYGNKVRYDYTDAKDIFITTTIEHCPVCDKYLIGGYSAVTDTLRSIHTNNLVIILPGTLSSYKPNKGVVVDSYTNFDEDTEVIADFSYNKGKFMFTYVNINENKIYKTVWHRNIVIPNNDMLSEAFTITKIKGMDFISFTNAARRALKRLNRGKIESMMLWHHGKTFKKSNLELKYVGLVTLQTQEPYVYAEFEYGDAIYTYHLTAEEVTKCKNENDVARFILKNILNKIKIEKRKIKMVEKVKELSEKDDSELLEIISKIPKFTITDSLTVGNCEFGTRKWAEEIGLTYEKSSITGQELAKILSQHPDHLKDKEFLKVLAYKLV